MPKISSVFSFPEQTSATGSPVEFKMVVCSVSQGVFCKPNHEDKMLKSTDTVLKRFIKVGCLCATGSLVLFLGSCNKQESASNAREQATTTPHRHVEKPNSMTLDNIRSIQRGIVANAKSSKIDYTRFAEVEKALNAFTPTELVQLLESLDPKQDIDKDLMFKVIHLLAKRDPGLALSEAMKLPEGTSAIYVSSFYEKLVESDPNAVVNWILANGMESHLAWKLSNNCANDLAKNAPAVAAKMLSQCNDEKILKYFGLHLLGVLASQEPEQALKLAGHFPEALKADAYREALVCFAMQDPVAAYNSLLAMNDPKISAKAYLGIFNAWFEKDPKAASQELGSIPASSIQQVLQQQGQVTKLVSGDAHVAIEVLDKLVITEANSSIFMTAVHELGLKDPEKAVSWLETFPDSPKKGDMIKELALARAMQDPASTVPEILKEGGKYQAQVIDGLATAWGQKDTTAALKFSQSLPVEEQQIFAATVLGVAIKANPSAAAEFIANGSYPVAARDSSSYLGAVRSTGFTYAATDIQKAVDWSDSLSPKEREAAVSGVASLWAERDPNATSEWISKLPAGAVKTAAVLSLVGQIEKSDPASAKQWRDSIK